MLVTVIVPFYNRIDKLLLSLESVQKQTYSELEILLINDGSTDRIDKLRHVCSKDKRVTIIDIGKNMGAAHARNTGISLAKGEYIAFLDSDDIFINNKIELQLEGMIKYEKGISHTSYIRRDITDEVVDEVVHSGELAGNPIPNLIHTCPIATPTVMIKKVFLINSKVKFRENIHIGEDICFWLDLFKSGIRLLGIDIPLTIVNVDKNSASMNKDKACEGYRNILIYLINDPDYKIYKDNISLLYRAYRSMLDGREYDYDHFKFNN